MLKIIKYQSTEFKVVKLQPQQAYPLSLSDLKSKILLASAEDYLDAQQNPSQYSHSQDEIWSSHFKVNNFFSKHDITKKKFFVYHAQKFTMVFLQPGNFFPAWDICIKVPLVIKNCLPFELKIRTYQIRKYI
jgi:hypothetical protein